MSEDAAPHWHLPTGYAIEVVHGRIGPSVRDEVVGMWTAERALAPAEARRRADELVVVARAADGEVAGVATAYVAPLTGIERRYWFYRTFVRPAHRTMWALVGGMYDAAVPALRKASWAQSALGIAAVVENRALMRPGARAEFEASGLRLLGTDAAGRDVWCMHFDGSTPETPPGLRVPE